MSFSFCCSGGGGGGSGECGYMHEARGIKCVRAPVINNASSPFGRSVARLARELYLRILLVMARTDERKQAVGRASGK
jgi:hypothetical protein